MSKNYSLCRRRLRAVLPSEGTLGPLGLVILRTGPLSPITSRERLAVCFEIRVHVRALVLGYAEPFCERLCSLKKPECNVCRYSRKPRTVRGRDSFDRCSELGDDTRQNFLEGSPTKIPHRWRNSARTASELSGSGNKFPGKRCVQQAVRKHSISAVRLALQRLLKRRPEHACGPSMLNTESVRRTLIHGRPR